MLGSGTACFTAVACVGLGMFPALVQAETLSEFELKAALIYKFAQFTDWPQASPTQFNICILGKDPFGAAINVLKERKLKDAPVAVQRLSSVPSDADGCQVVYLNPVNYNQLAQWISSLGKLPILTISDDPRAWDDGVMIALISEPNRIAFNINASVARRVGISFRAQMLQIAREVR